MSARPIPLRIHTCAHTHHVGSCPDCQRRAAERDRRHNREADVIRHFARNAPPA